MNPKLFRAVPLMALGLWGCADDPTLIIVIEHPTLIEVSPGAFMGDVPCLAGDGSMQRYVATITDVTVDEEAGTTENFTLASSGPTSCNVAVGFSFVVPGHSYSAEIDAYDRDDIQPLGSLDSGARVMVDPETGETVLPRWTTSCGRDPGTSVLAVNEIVRQMDDCAPLVDSEPPSDEASVRVGVEASLGSLECGTDAGAVARFQVQASGQAPLSAACGESVELAGLSPGVAAELQLSAFEEGQAEATWGALCSVTPIAGVVVEAECAALSDRGAVEIDLPALLTSASLSCDSSLRELNVVVVAGGDVPTQRITPPGCERALRMSDLPPGALTLEVTTTLGDGAPGPSATCSATVVPGLVVSASCQNE